MLSNTQTAVPAAARLGAVQTVNTDGYSDPEGANPVTVAATRAIAAAEAKSQSAGGSDQIDGSSHWDQRLARLKTASERYQREADRRREIQAAARKVAPMPAEIRCFGGIRGILNDRSVGADEQLRRISLWEEWEPRHRAALAAAGWTAEDQAYFDDDYDSATDDIAVAEAELMATPAPTIEALAIKLANLLADEAGHMIGDDVDSPRFLAAVLSSEGYVERMLAACVQDALRLAGSNDERSWVAPFSAQPLFDLAASEGFAVEATDNADAYKPMLCLMNVSAPENAVPSNELAAAICGLTPAERSVVCKSILSRKGETLQ